MVGGVVMGWGGGGSEWVVWCVGEGREEVVVVEGLLVVSFSSWKIGVRRGVEAAEESDDEVAEADDMVDGQIRCSC